MSHEAAEGIEFAVFASAGMSLNAWQRNKPGNTKYRL